MNITVIKRQTLRELHRAIVDNERRGWECVARYQKIKSLRKEWAYNRSNDDFKDFRGVSEYEYYIVKMRKVETA